MNKKTKQIILGVLIIVAALAGAFIKLADDDPTTNPDTAQVIEDVVGGVTIIINDEVAE